MCQTATNDLLCPYKFISFYRTLCAPTQQRLFCQPATKKQLKDIAATNSPYLYNEKQPVGENSIDANTKDFAKEMGFDNWHVTGAALATYETNQMAPFKTPVNYESSKTIIQQNHINYVQCNIFLQQHLDLSYL
jgi:hypothetical protein